MDGAGDKVELPHALTGLRVSEPCAGNANSVASPEHAIRIRFRPPYLQTCKHDARGDALALVMEKMAQKFRGYPLWTQYIVGREFIDARIDELQTAQVDFVDGIYEEIDASVWCRRVLESFDKFLDANKMGGDEGVSKLEKPQGWDKFPFSQSTHKNRKPKMEDRHVVMPTMSVVCPANKIDNQTALFAAFDGHHGHEVAAYAAAHLHECLLHYLGEEKRGVGMELLEKSFNLLDRRLLLRCEKENIKSGATACCVLIEEGNAHVAWCGDSSAGVLSSTRVTTLTRRHIPNDPDELKRIEEAGGIVVLIQGEARVNGVLNISRSLGDIQARPMISSTPEVKTHQIESDDLALLLSTDGVWDQLPEAALYVHIHEFISSHSWEEYENLSDYIIQKTRESGASDNLTFIVVFLQPVERVWAEIRAISP